MIQNGVTYIGKSAVVLADMMWFPKILHKILKVLILGKGACYNIRRA
jgi:hypothetical protein